MTAEKERNTTSEIHLSGIERYSSPLHMRKNAVLNRKKYCVMIPKAVEYSGYLQGRLAGKKFYEFESFKK